jgi:hypothetical protein
MPEPAPQAAPPSPPQKGAGLVAKARAHKALTAVIAVAGFLGLGGIFGQWAVDRIGDLVSGENPPAGFNELHTAWQDTAKLNERLLSAGFEANQNLEEGVTSTIRGVTPPELEDDLNELRAVKRDASSLAGRVRATSTDLPGPRADLLRLVTLLRDTTQRVQTGVMKAYGRSGGAPIYGGSAGFAPIFTNELREDVVQHDAVVREVEAGLRPTARRWERSVPEIRGWNRLAFPHMNSDTPSY